jgi:hypothetical protein
MDLRSCVPEMQATLTPSSGLRFPQVVIYPELESAVGLMDVFIYPDFS